ncbi:transglycosylase family protein [Streptomyces sp. NPDC054841]
MRSGNGRHRRPRQAPALIVAAGVTGSAIAIPLLGAGSASAADSATWNRVADCESGGMWSADLGNGYYGGLQLTQETWEAYGGTAYAPRADLASRAQQISVAEMVFAAQGPAAWPNCSEIAGLVQGDATLGSGAASTPAAQDGGAKSPSFGDGADVAPEPDADDADKDGAKPSAPASSAPDAKPSTPTAKPSTPAGSASGSGEDSDGAGEGDAAADAGKDTGTGKHRGAPADNEDEAGNSGDERESGRHASRGDGSAREGAATGDGYTVLPGDSLSSIADAEKVPGGWPALYEANREVVGSDADLILPGQSLDLGLDQEQLKK